jgi:hypothetical protein
MRLAGNLIKLTPIVHHDTTAQVVYHTNVTVIDEARRNSKTGFNLCQDTDLTAVDDFLQATCCRMEAAHHKPGTHQQDMYAYR